MNSEIKNDEKSGISQPYQCEELYGKVIEFTGYNSMNCIPRRHDLLDEELVRKVDALIQSTGSNTAHCDEQLLFLPNSFKEFHEKNSDSVTNYKILIFGILPDGRKSAVILEGIIPYFEIQKPDHMNVQMFHTKTKQILSEKFQNSTVEEIVKHGFNEYKKTGNIYLRLHFYNIWDRKNALKYFTETMGWKTTTDDNNHYERVVCRNNNFKMGSWAVINKYTSYKKEDVSRLPRTFRINYKDFVHYSGDIMASHILSHDRTIVETWDIEAYTNTGEMPSAVNDDDVVFNISKTYHLKDSKNPFLKIGLVSRPCNGRPDKLTVVCKNEKDLIKASFILNSIMQPDFIAGFNDGDFDWPFVIVKARKYNILIFIKEQLTLFNDYRYNAMGRRQKIDSIIKWDCQKKTVKIEADMSAYSTTLTLPGYINIDVRTMFRKLYPTEPKSSLKFYLELSKLGGKEDMPISTLFRIFADSLRIEKDINTMSEENNVCGLDDVYKRFEKNKEEMADVVHYCTVDAMRCQELMHKVNIISDKREVANISHTTLYDALYFADGMKVRNLIIAEGQKRGLLFSTLPAQYVGDGQYPGAYVFPPIKGPVKPKLTIRERVAIDADWEKIPEEDIKKMENAIYTSKEHIDVDKKMGDLDEKLIFSYDKSEKLFEAFKSEKTSYPVPGLDFSSLYPSIIMTYNLSPEYMVFTEKRALELKKDGHELHKIEFMFGNRQQIAWSIRHDTSDGVKLLPGKYKNKFGLYPFILNGLFNKRSIMKKELNAVAKRKEELEKECGHETQEYQMIQFKYSYIDSKQKALKVFMNTFYGETGNKRSPFFVLAIAGGITSAGQRNIKNVSNLVTSKGCKLYYGDTDSVYISCPAHHFTELDRKYFGGRMTKIDYCTVLIRETFKHIESIKNMVNDYLISDNGTTFLRMAYEEVLFPCVFLLKKMYAGVEHKHIVNFSPHPDELFTKGVSLKRRGTSEVLKTVCKEVLMKILDINTTVTVRDIIIRKIEDIYNRDWKTEDFKKTAVYKPSKQNVSVRTFMKRMEDRRDPLCPSPQPGERFEYVVVRKYPFKYDNKGRKSSILVGDCWEYYTYAVANNLPIDLDYYMTGGIIGQFAQFTAYHPEFHVLPIDNSQEAYDISEKKTLLTSKKFIEGICKKMANTPACQGPIIKKLYKLANNTYKKALQSVFNGVDGEAQIQLMSYDYSSGGDLYAYLRSILLAESKKSAGYYAECYIDHMRKKFGKKIIYPLLKIFSNTQEPLIKYRTMYVAQIEDRTRKTFVENMKGFTELFSSRDDIIEDMMKNMKSRLSLDDLENTAWDGGKMPKHESFEGDPKISDILNGESKEHVDYQEKLERQKDSVIMLYDIYNTLSASMTYLENTKAIIERLHYYISKERQENPTPPGVTFDNEHDNAIMFIRQNLIDF